MTRAAGADYGTYDSTLTVSVGTTGSFTGLCRGGDNLFVGNNQGDVISILTLAGARIQHLQQAQRIRRLFCN